MMTLDERLSRLERQNEALERRLCGWRRGAAAAAVLAAAGLMTGLAQDKPQALRATSLIIVDEGGKERLVFGADEREAGLEIRSAAGKVIVAIGAGNDGGGMVVRDPGGKDRVLVGVGEDGTGLEVHAKDGTTLAEFGEHKGAGGIDLKDQAGTSRFQVGTEDDGTGLKILDANGTRRAALGTGMIPNLGEGAGLWVFDKQGRPRLGVGANSDGEGGTLTLDAHGKPANR